MPLGYTLLIPILPTTNSLVDYRIWELSTLLAHGLDRQTLPADLIIKMKNYLLLHYYLFLL